MSRGEICVENFLSPANSASFGSRFQPKQDRFATCFKKCGTNYWGTGRRPTSVTVDLI